jgi:hypothetical protein
VKGNASWAEYTVPLLETLCDLGLLQSAQDFRTPGTLVADWPKVLEEAVACPRGCKHGMCGAEGCVCNKGYRGPECEKRDGKKELVILLEDQTLSGRLSQMQSLNYNEIYQA